MKNVKIFLWVMVVTLVAACKDDDEPGVTLTAPTLNDATEITTTSFTASWNTVTGAQTYLLDVATDAAFTSLIEGYNKKEVTTTSETLEELLPGETYYFRVYAKQGDVTSSASATKEVTLEEAPALAAPVLNDASDITDTGFTASWSTVEGANGYLLDVALDAEFTEYVDGYDKKTLTETSETIEGLTTGETYYFRVFATAGEETSAASESKEITLEADPG